MDNVIDGLNKTKKIPKDFVAKNLTKNRIVNVTLFIGAMVVLGMFDFLNLKLDITYIITAEFWGNIGIKAGASSMLYISSSRETIALLIANDIDYTSRKKLVDEASLKHRGDELNKSLAIYNLGKKTEVYKYNINNKIGTLDISATYDDQIAWMRYSKSLKSDKVAEMPNNEYCQKRKLYLEQLSDEFISANIDYIQIVYDITYANELTTGREELQVGKSPMKVSVAKSRSKKIVYRIMQFIGISLLWSMFLKDIKDNITFVPIIIAIFSTIIFVVWALISGMGDGKIEYETIELPKIDFRFQRFKDYIRYERFENKWNVLKQREWKSEDANDLTISTILTEQKGT